MLRNFSGWTVKKLKNTITIHKDLTIVKVKEIRVHGSLNGGYNHVVCIALRIYRLYVITDIRRKE